jgi:glycosyltransferase involved in cell wall biosynthesis
MAERIVAPRVSFVIPVKNDADRLRRCLHTIAANAYPRSAVEVIVADNGSIDASSAIAVQAGAIVQYAPGYRVAELRNRAAAAASGTIIAFVDSDHEISSGWIQAAVDALQDPRVGAAGALCRPPADGTWVQRMYGVLRGRTVGRSDVEWLGAGNMAVGREAFVSVGGFDESLETCEDVDLCQRLRARGWRVLGDERLDNIHLGDPATLRRLFRAERWRGRDNLRVTFRPGWTWRELPSALVPIGEAALLTTALLVSLSSIWFGPISLAFAAFTVGLALSASVARAIKMVVSGRLSGAAAIVQAMAVAVTFDLARAVALLGRAGHHRRATQADVRLPV